VKRLLGIVAAGLLLAATSASARELELVPAEGPGGCVRAHGIAAVGTKDVSVQVSGKDLMVLETGNDWVSFIVPADAPLGKLEIGFRVKGEAHRATYTHKARKTKKEIEDDQRRAGEGASIYNGDLVTMKRFELILEGGVPSVVVEGTTKIPEPFFLTVTLGAESRDGSRPIAAHKVKISGDTWKTRFGPAEGWAGKTLVAGKYSALAEFEMAKQSALNLANRGWPEKIPENQRESYQRAWANKIDDLGTSDDRKHQQEEIRGHYAELCRSATACLTSLDRAYAAAGRCYFKKPKGGYDEDAWAKWADGLGDPGTKAAKTDRRFLRGDFLDAEAWQKWVEKDLYPRLAALVREHEAIKSRYAGARDERSEVEGSVLVSIIVRLARTYSGELFQRNGLEVPDSLRSPPDLGGDLGTVAASTGYFEQMRDALLQRLGVPREK
jgi:hypothetical protein